MCGKFLEVGVLFMGIVLSVCVCVWLVCFVDVLAGLFVMVCFLEGLFVDTFRL